MYKTVSSQCQRDALETIYNCLGGSEWTVHDNWLSDDHHYSDWSGVRCSDGNEELVAALELSQNNLHGRLDDPVVVAALLKLAPSLEQLWLSENALTGNLASVLTTDAFPYLNIIDVGGNRLCGSLHPAFATASHFSFFDTSGNELTSYYRYTSNNNKDDDNKAAVLDFPTMTTSSPINHVYVVPSVLTKQQGVALIDLAIGYTETNCGWQTDRHKDYKTTDIDIAVCGGELLDTCNAYLKTQILPLLAHLFGFPMIDFAIEDLFLAKYSAAEGQQRFLSQHRDDSELSFVITLNDPKTDFCGGGTRFVLQDKTLAPDIPGTGVFFSGRHLHSGVEVTEGIRYILAGFVRVYPSTPEGVAKLECIVQDPQRRRRLE
jgi:hypothetical protein